MHVVNRVLIVGGGLAGVSAAIALQREGIDVEIVEREPVWGALGTGITLMGPAMRALKQLGVLGQCLAEGDGGSEMCLFSAEGELLHTLEIPGLLGQEWPAVGGMMRPTLHRILAETAQEEGASVRTGTTVDLLEQHADRIDVELSDGSNESYDLVLGADGMRSQVRQLVFGDDAPEPQPLGQAVWRALVDRPASVTGEFQFYGPGLKRGSRRSARTGCMSFWSSRWPTASCRRLRSGRRGCANCCRSSAVSWPRSERRSPSPSRSTCASSTGFSCPRRGTAAESC